MLVVNQEITFRSLPGLSVFPDNESESAFYAVASKPRLARDETGAPQISLMAYGKRKDGIFQPTGGFLSLTVSLGIRAEEETVLMAELKSLLAVEFPPATPDDPPPPAPVLRAFPWISGAVALSLGSNISAAGNPSMFGDNRCSFSIKLDAGQTKSLLAAWKNQLRDSSVRYQTTVKTGPPSQSQAEFNESHTETRDNDTFTLHSRVTVAVSATQTEPPAMLFEGPVDLRAEDVERQLNQVEM